MDTLGDYIVNEARKYIGVKWRHKGRSSTCLDCIGLIIKVYTDLGLLNRDYFDYGRNPETYILRQELLRLNFKQVYNINNGDLGLFKTSIFPCHVGIMTRKNDTISLLHSNSEVGYVLEEPFSSRWQQAKVGFFRHPNANI